MQGVQGERIGRLDWHQECRNSGGERKGRWAPDGECLECQAEEFGCVPSGPGRPFGVRSSMLME